MDPIGSVPRNSFIPAPAASQAGQIQPGQNQADDAGGDDQSQAAVESADAVVVNIGQGIRNPDEALKVATGLSGRLTPSFVGEQEKNLSPGALALVV